MAGWGFVKRLRRQGRVVQLSTRHLGGLDECLRPFRLARTGRRPRLGARPELTRRSQKCTLLFRPSTLSRFCECMKANQSSSPQSSHRSYADGAQGTPPERRRVKKVREGAHGVYDGATQGNPD